MKKLFLFVVFSLSSLFMMARGLEVETTRQGKTYLVNAQGKRVCGPYTSVEYLDAHGIWLVAKGGSRDDAGQLQKCKWGLVDSDGKTVLKPEYDYIGQIGSENIFWINKGGKNIADAKDIKKSISSHMEWFMTEEDDPEELMKEKNRVEDVFCGGKLSVDGAKIYGGKYGFADVSGKILVAPKWADVAPVFSEGLAWVSKKAVSPQILAYTLKPYESPGYSVYGGEQSVSYPMPLVNKKAGVVSLSGEMIVPAKYADIEQYKDGLAVARRKKGLKLFAGFLDLNGDEVTPLIFMNASNEEGDFPKVAAGTMSVPEECYASHVRNNDASSVVPGKTAIVGRNGKLVTPLKYDAIFIPSCGLAPCLESGYGGYLDRDGREVVPPVLNKLYDFKDNLAVVALPKGLRGLKKDSSLPLAVGNRRETTEDVNFGVIDVTGKAVTDFDFNKYVGCSDDIFLFRHNSGKVMWIDYAGNRILSDLGNTGAGLFYDGIASVKMGDKWGYISKDGRILVDCIYSEVSSRFTDGVAAVCLKNALNSAWGGIDMNGTVVIPVMLPTARDVNMLRKQLVLRNDGRPMVKRDVDIYLIRKKNATIRFGITDKIPEENWDY